MDLSKVRTILGIPDSSKDETTGKCVENAPTVDDARIHPLFPKIASECVKMQELSDSEEEEAHDSSLVRDQDENQDSKETGQENILKYLQTNFLDFDDSGSETCTNSRKRVVERNAEYVDHLEIDEELKLIGYPEAHTPKLCDTSECTEVLYSSDLLIDWKGLGSFKCNHFVIKKAGSGADGVVFFAMRKDKYDASAGYERNISHLCAVKFSPSLGRELAILKCLPKHSRFIELLEHEEAQLGQERWLTMSAVTGGSFWDFLGHLIKKTGTVPPSFICHVMAQLGEALAFLHGWAITSSGKAKQTGNRKLCHRDVHGGNILIEPTFRDSEIWPDLKIIDFNHARLEPEHHGLNSMAKELFNSESQRDWFRFGALIKMTILDCHSYDLEGCINHKGTDNTPGRYFSKNDVWFQNWDRKLRPESPERIDDRLILTDLVRTARKRREYLKNLPLGVDYQDFFSHPISAQDLAAAFERSRGSNSDS